MIYVLVLILGFQIGMGVSEIGSRLEARRYPTRTMEDMIRLHPAWLTPLMVATMLFNVIAILSA